MLILSHVTALPDDPTSTAVQQNDPYMVRTNSLGTPNSLHHQSSSRISNPVMAPRPMEIDLSEFMLDTDLDFLNGTFDIGSHY